MNYYIETERHCGTKRLHTIETLRARRKALGFQKEAINALTDSEHSWFRVATDIDLDLQGGLMTSDSWRQIIGVTIFLVLILLLRWRR